MNESIFGALSLHCRLSAVCLARKMRKNNARMGIPPGSRES
jgi:hypothetical protein